jgi:hypothetical protein
MKIAQKIFAASVSMGLASLLSGCGPTNNQQTAPVGGQGAYMSGGNCISSSGQIVSPALCQGGYGAQGNGYGNGYGQYGSGFGGTSCSGMYYMNSGYGMQQMNCTPTSCRGYSLVNSSGQQVFCQ